MTTEQMFLMFAMMHVASANKSEKQARQFAVILLIAAVVIAILKWVKA